MSTKNKGVAAKALLEMDSITSAIKEESKKALSSLLAEAVRDALREGCNEDDNEEDDYEVLDGEKDGNGAEDNEDQTNETGDVSENGEDNLENGDMNQDPSMGAENGVQDGQEAPAQDGEIPSEDGENEEGMDEFSQYQVGADTYDLSGEKDYNKVARVFKLLKDTDQVVVRNDGDKITLKDNEAGTEYMIDLGGDEGEEPTATEQEIEGEGDVQNGLNEDADIAGLPNDIEDDGMEDGSEFLDDFNSIENDDFTGEDNNLNESKKTKKPMKESKETLFEVDLGYTDSYQDKDPISGLSTSEPSKSGKSWEKGVPTGTSKPWAGETKSKGEPFKKTEKVEGSVNEEDNSNEETVDEAATSKNRRDRRHTTKTNSKAIGDTAYNPEVTKVDNGKLEESLKKIKRENKALKEAVVALKENLQKAYMTNVNLGKITKLFVENTTSHAEKVEIVNRFCNEAKTVEQSNALYESIRKGLNKVNTNPMNINESSKTAKGTQNINENKVYRSESVLKTIDLMNRVMGC